MRYMRWIAVVSLALGAGAAAAADPVFRCEGKDGRVTYSDSACPTDSRSSRKLDQAPAVVLPGKDAGRDAREAGQIAQTRNARLDPVLENRQLDEQIAAARRECAELSRRVQYARQDLEGASPSQRATAELALRRAQDQFALYCKSR